MKSKIIISGVLLSIAFQKNVLADGIAAIIVNCTEKTIVSGSATNPNGTVPFELPGPYARFFAGDLDADTPEFSFQAKGTDGSSVFLTQAEKDPEYSNGTQASVSGNSISCPGTMDFPYHSPFTLWVVRFSDNSFKGCGEHINCSSATEFMKKNPESKDRKKKPSLS